MNRLTLTLDGRHAALDHVLTVFEKPVYVRAKVFKGLDPIIFQPLDGVERDEADERAHAKFVEDIILAAQYVIEEAVLLIPELIIALAHVLHRRADIDVVL